MTKLQLPDTLLKKLDGGGLVPDSLLEIPDLPVVLIRILKILWSNPAVLPFFDQALSENL
jgi:hypothetical protein